ncbi:putative Histidine kinase [Candidatus Hydrogenisulfobacillus filiaventi]|uniref:histidine kinase n=1 Tax=Candidatus Hydrogenisulfobacillus filiaventi TaxID=2707344 RepID=A0A6F8ZG96_9FIRM|nr:HAMP domain-containing sensor histidine kinase [Bacillota bacterium]CAB1129015.1 putative Histidine kinase [Candidatus Hydrogenisulfobacillus filiaventi]
MSRRPRWRGWPIALALMLGIGMLMLATEVGSGYFVYSLSRSRLIETAARSAWIKARAQAARLVAEQRQRPEQSALEDLADLAAGQEYLLVIDRQGRFRMAAGPVPPAFPARSWIREPSRGWFLYRSVPYVFARVPLGGDHFLVVVDRITRRWALLAAVRQGLLIGGAVLFLSSMAGVAWVVWLITRPLAAIEVAAERIARDPEGGQALPVTSALREVRSLTASLNRMVDRLRAAQARERQFAGDAAHALRTPIHIIRGYLGTLARWGHQDPEVARQALATLTREAAGMERLVDRLLILSRLEAGQVTTAPVALDPGLFLEGLRPELADACPHHALQLDTGSGPLPPVRAEPDLVQAILRVLVENADSYGLPETPVMVRVGSGPDGRVWFAVENRGPALPADVLPHLFERFYRGHAPAESGHYGLGLAIADRMLTLLEGQWDIGSREGVTRFAFGLPAAGGIAEARPAQIAGRRSRTRGGEAG